MGRADGADEWGFTVGVEFLDSPAAARERPGEDVDGGDGDEDEENVLLHAAGRHRVGVGRQLGEQAIEAAGRAIGTQIVSVLRGVADGLDKDNQARSGRFVPDGLRLDTMEITFGVTLEGGLDGGVALLTVKGAASAEVRVALTRYSDVYGSE